MKISWRIWLLVIVLAFSAMTILDFSATSNILVGFLIILIPIALIYGKNKTSRTIFIILIALSIIAVIFFSFQKGVLITSVEQNSTEFNEGLRKGMIVTSINGKIIENVEDYDSIISSMNFTTKQKVEILTNSKEFIFLIDTPLKISVSEVPKTNIKTGLDLSGGARALVKPENVSLSASEISDLVSVTSNRLNVFGISDVNVRSVSDLTGNNYLLVEVAGITSEDLKNLVGQQGKFEAKIGNETVFVGGEKDISSVCRNDAKCARIETCGATPGGYGCTFAFVIYLSEESAKRHADITSKLGTNETNPGYLSKKLDLYLDDKLVDSLFISEDLKGRVTTQIQVSGSGTGETESDAYDAAKASMKNLQTVLITGSLPYKLEVVKLDTISPALGKEFSKNILYLGIVVFIIVSILIFIKYRKIKITSAVILTMLSELVITLAIAALIRWNLDAPSIAGIIAGIGTGVDDQIVIIDESVSSGESSLKDRIKRALFIIIGAFFTVFAAMLPLFWAGAGLLRGFALTTLIGVSVGILITRPAFADIMRKIGN